MFSTNFKNSVLPLKYLTLGRQFELLKKRLTCPTQGKSRERLVRGSAILLQNYRGGVFYTYDTLRKTKKESIHSNVLSHVSATKNNDFPKNKAVYTAA